MKEITHDEIVARITSLKGTAIVGFEAITDARAVKKDRENHENKNPFSLVEKHIRGVAIVGANYENGVNREAARQGINDAEFESQGLPDYLSWEIPGKILRHNNGTRYLRTQTTPGKRQNQPAKVIAWYGDGKVVNHSDVKPFLPIPKPVGTQAAIGLETKRAQVWVNNYKLESLTKIRLNGETFRVKRG